MDFIKGLLSRKAPGAFAKGTAVSGLVTHQLHGYPINVRSLGTVVRVKKGQYTVDFPAEPISRWQPFSSVFTEDQLRAAASEDEAPYTLPAALA